jgi:hypothetical protein
VGVVRIRPFGALGNPTVNRLDFNWSQRRFTFRRHPQFGIGAADRLSQAAFRRVAGHDATPAGISARQSLIAPIEPQSAFLMSACMTSVAMRLQDGLHVAQKVDCVIRLGIRGDD